MSPVSYTHLDVYKRQVGAQAVEFGGVVQCGLVAFSLLGDHVQDNGFVEVLDVGKGADEGGDCLLYTSRCV